MKEILKLVEVSKLYYEQNLTQLEIAKKMKVSRPVVSKLLSEARALGIVKIEIKSPIGTNALLLDQLSMKFNLQGGVIVPSGFTGKKFDQQVLISQAALYIDRILPSLQRVGIGWGYTIGCLIDELKPLKMGNYPKGIVCPLIGTAPSELKWYQSNELTRIFAEKTGYTTHYLHAPAFPTTLENKELFENTQEYRELLRLWSTLDAVILGLGVYPSVPDQATAARFGNLLKERKAAGMIATYYYDEHGEFIESPNDIVIRIPLEYLRRTRVILVAGGSEEKLKSMRGVLKTGIITHLVIDEATASELIQSGGEERG